MKKKGEKLREKPEIRYERCLWRFDFSGLLESSAFAN